MNQAFLIMYITRRFKRTRVFNKWSFSDMARDFFKLAGILSVGNIIEKGIPLFMLPILTRLLTTADYGVITTINALRNTLEPLIWMSVPAAVGIAYYSRDQHDFDFKCYLFNALIISSALFVIVLISLTGLQSRIAGFDRIEFGWLLFVTFYVWSTAVGGINTKLWIYQKKAVYYSLFNSLKALANIGLSIIIVYFWMRNWQGRVIGIGIVEIGFNIVAVVMLIRYNGVAIRINRAYLKDLVKFGLPLLPHSFGLVVLITADKYFINAMLDFSVLGLYGVGYTLGMTLIIFSIPLDRALEPIIYESLSQKLPARSREAGRGRRCR